MDYLFKPNRVPLMVNRRDFPAPMITPSQSTVLDKERQTLARFGVPNMRYFLDDAPELPFLSHDVACRA
jgi:hypothetical protein